jgi:hypothetical protein
VDIYTQGLRCQDVNADVRNFDATSPILAPVKKTRLVGMAADLAALVRGREVIDDMAALESVAAAELDIPSTSFDSVLTLLVGPPRKVDRKPGPECRVLPGPLDKLGWHAATGRR